MTKSKETPTPTARQYDAFGALFVYFNQQLFGWQLGPCLLTFGRHSKSVGYFTADSWKGRVNAVGIPEIAVSADGLGRTRQEVLSTLVHEMVHHWQHQHGKPARGRYHDRQWAAKMEAVGLQPSHNGQPGGKKTGDRMTHYVIAGGPFERAAAAVADADYLPFLAIPLVDGGKAKSKGVRKLKYECPDCEQCCWGKPGLRLSCSDCDKRLVSEND